jgi:hypothetical protein
VVLLLLLVVLLLLLVVLLLLLVVLLLLFPDAHLAGPGRSTLARSLLSALPPAQPAPAPWPVRVRGHSTLQDCTSNTSVNTMCPYKVWSTTRLEWSRVTRARVPRQTAP